MPQLFQVIRCYKCLVFQVHQTRKSNKWECKMCGEKQSVKRHYGLGNPKDCRLHVQKLNGIRGEVDVLKQNEIDSDDEFENKQPNLTVLETQFKKESRWSNYVEEIVPPQMDNNSNMYLNGTEVVLDIPQKRKSTLVRNYNKKNMKSQPHNEEIGVVWNKVGDEAVYSLQTSELEINNVKKKWNPPIGSLKQTDKIRNYSCSSASVKPEPTLSLKCPYTSVKKEANSSHIACKFNAPKINRNSKWAQFADEEEPTEEIDNLTLPCVEQFSEEYDEFSKKIGNQVSTCIEQSQNKSNSLFALCDDGDLDTILDL